MEKKFALVGSGIKESLSPALFKAAYDGKYKYELLDGTDFKALLASIRKDYQAVNVTAPFKEEAFRAAGQASEAAQLCRAANMLVRQPDGSLLADNSDFEGVTISLLSAYAVSEEDLDVDDEDAFGDFIADKTALIVGCGGAGKAAAAAAVTLGYGKTILMNRTLATAEAFRKHLCSFYDDIPADEMEVRPLEDFEAAFNEADLVIYTLPCKCFEKLEVTPDKKKFVLEANYTAPCLEYLKDSVNYISGLNWLLNQALVSYESFTGAEPDEDKMKGIL